MRSWIEKQIGELVRDGIMGAQLGNQGVQVRRATEAIGMLFKLEVSFIAFCNSIMYGFVLYAYGYYYYVMQ